MGKLLLAHFRTSADRKLCLPLDEPAIYVSSSLATPMSVLGEKVWGTFSRSPHETNRHYATNCSSEIVADFVNFASYSIAHPRKYS